MSEPKRWELWEVIMEDTNSEWVRYDDYAHLKSEVERLRHLEGVASSVDFYQQEYEKLKADVERLNEELNYRKAIAIRVGIEAAKEGKPSV